MVDRDSAFFSGIII